MLPRLYLDEIGYTSPNLELRELFHQCCKKQNNHRSLKREARDYVYTFRYPEEYTLTRALIRPALTESIGDVTQAAGEEELDDSDDEDGYQRKLYN